MTRVQLALQAMIGAFGDGPDSEDFWSVAADAATCDCINPDHPHTSQGIREAVLKEAQLALAESVVV